MRFLESFHLALANLWSHKLRSFLTLLGVLISVLTLVAVVSLVAGIDRYVAERVSQLGSDVFIISRFGLLTNARQIVEAEKRPRLSMQDFRALEEGMGNSVLVGAILFESGRMTSGATTIRSSVRGITSNMAQIRSETLASGRYLNETDSQYRRLVCLIGQDVADQLFPGRDPVGKTVRLQGLRFQIIGLANPVGSVFGQSQDNFVYIPLTTAQKMFGSRQSLSFQFRVQVVENMAAAQDRARLILRTRHHLSYAEPDDFGIVSPSAVLELWQDLTGTIARVATIVTVVFLLVGGIVIMNIMLAAVTERTWEIGIRKAVGATSSDVRMQFLVESACIASGGGFLGILLALCFTQLVSWLSPVTAEFSLWTALAALFISATVGLFFGIYPASRAARLHPIAALRAETM
ncbi:MAG: hypothetical protein A3F68_07550 [Acidobacteria bacterium RIFCSPLOWO2_12_FULL_54_10]|nr:MAG: hypothetical protein A3F68_07550 [Acidobacteria bacterium RIFCSPLOWO2_12_FULL_54_10]